MCLCYTCAGPVCPWQLNGLGAIEKLENLQNDLAGRAFGYMILLVRKHAIPSWGWAQREPETMFFGGETHWTNADAPGEKLNLDVNNARHVASALRLEANSCRGRFANGPSLQWQLQTLNWSLVLQLWIANLSHVTSVLRPRNIHKANTFFKAVFRQHTGLIQASSLSFVLWFLGFLCPKPPLNVH